MERFEQWAEDQRQRNTQDQAEDHTIENTEGGLNHDH